MLAQKTIRAGYYWPTIKKDSALLVKTCDKCQRFSRIMKSSPEKLTPPHFSMAICEMGGGYSWPNAGGERWTKVLGCSCRLFY
jgi:hypothetical protein